MCLIVEIVGEDVVTSEQYFCILTEDAPSNNTTYYIVGVKFASVGKKTEISGYNTRWEMNSTQRPRDRSWDLSCVEAVYIYIYTHIYMYTPILYTCPYRLLPRGKQPGVRYRVRAIIDRANEECFFFARANETRKKNWRTYLARNRRDVTMTKRKRSRRREITLYVCEIHRVLLPVTFFSPSFVNDCPELRNVFTRCFTIIEINLATRSL